MSVCTINETAQILAIIVPIILTALIYFFILKKKFKSKTKVITTSVLIFISLVLISMFVASYYGISCTGPLIGNNGQVIG